MPAELVDDVGLAIAAILTAVGSLIAVLAGWAKQRAEIAALKAQMEPTPPPAPAPSRALLPHRAAVAPGTLYDVADETRHLVATAIQMISQLTAADTRISEWGTSEHARLDDRIDDHEVRLTRLEEATTTTGESDVQP